MEIWNVWHGSYLSAGVIKAIGSGLHTHRSDAHTVGAEGDFAARTDAFAGVNRTFVAVHFDGSGDSVITEEVKRFEPDYYVYGEHEPADCDATHLQEHFEALVPLGYENDCGDFGDVVLDVGAQDQRWSGMTVLRTTQRQRTRPTN